MLANMWLLNESGIHRVEMVSLIKHLARQHFVSEQAVLSWLSNNGPVTEVRGLDIVIPAGLVLGLPDKSTMELVSPFTRPLRVSYIVKEALMQEVLTEIQI